jgi:hypothetical protein
MPKMRLALLMPLAVLALLSPGRSVAGLPANVSGAMAFDTVADGLRQYRKETDEGKRAEWLKRLAPTRDPRVAVELWEVFAWVRGKRTAAIRQVARDCLADYFVPGEGVRGAEERAQAVCSWWSRSGADVRRRANQLPR